MLKIDDKYKQIQLAGYAESLRFSIESFRELARIEVKPLIINALNITDYDIIEKKDDEKQDQNDSSSSDNRKKADDGKKKKRKGSKLSKEKEL